MKKIILGAALVLGLGLSGVVQAAPPSSVPIPEGYDGSVWGDVGYIESKHHHFALIETNERQSPGQLVTVYSPTNEFLGLAKIAVAPHDKDVDGFYASLVQDYVMFGNDFQKGMLIKKLDHDGSDS